MDKKQRLIDDINRSITHIGFYEHTVNGFPIDIFKEEVEKLTVLQGLMYVKEFIKENPKYSEEHEIYITPWNQ